MILLLIIAGAVVLSLSPVSAEKPFVTIVAKGDQSYYMGEKVVFSGMNTNSTYLFITGPNLPDNGGKLASPKQNTSSGNPDSFTLVKTKPDKTWEYTWYTSDLRLDAGSYTVYAMTKPETIDQFNDLTTNGTVQIIYKKPFIATTITPSPVRSGQPFTVTGYAEGNPPAVQLWILGNSFFSLITVPVDNEENYTFTTNTQFSEKQDLRKSGIKPAAQNNQKTEERTVDKSRKISDLDQINFLVAAQCDVLCVKAAECYSMNGIVVAHDKLNRFLTRQSLTPETLWNEVEPYVENRSGWLIVDDTVIDNIHSKQIKLTYYQWSGKHHSVVKGIGLITLVWTDGTSTFPVDYRIYNKDGDELSKNEHFRDMLKTASVRGFQPSFVMFDSWYSGIDNQKCVSRLGWNWFSRIKKNRMVNPDHTDNRPVSSLTIPDDGLNVHMKKFGFVRVFHTVNKDGKERFWATNFLTMDHDNRTNLQAICWSIENYHRALKELCCFKDCKIRKEAGWTTESYQLLYQGFHPT